MNFDNDMKNKIEINHPTLLLKDNIQESTKSFRNNFGFSYFQYLRCFNDGSIGLLTNQTELFLHIRALKNKPIVYSSFEKQHESMASYWFLWDEALPVHPVQLAREKFGIYHGITLVRRSPSYYDMIAVGFPAPKENVGCFYLNTLKNINSFIHEFDKNHKHLIQIMGDHPITVPLERRDINYQKICLNNRKIRVHGKWGDSYITAQELACLRLLSVGFSYKEMAKQMNISSRTVETYIQRVKYRTHIKSRRDLIQLFLSCQ